MIYVVDSGVDTDHLNLLTQTLAKFLICRGSYDTFIGGGGPRPPFSVNDDF